MDRERRSLESGRLEIYVKNHLARLRAERNWSQGELAKRLNVSRQTIISIEKERYDPSLPLAFRISRIFSMPIEEIFIEEDE